MVTRTHHIGFTVKDLDRSVRFYQEGLGLELINRLFQAAGERCTPGAHPVCSPRRGAPGYGDQSAGERSFRCGGG